jgi:hypothetical protein
MRRATMATSDLSNFYRPKKGKYRRRTDVPIAKPVKGKYRAVDGTWHRKCTLLDISKYRCEVER